MQERPGGAQVRSVPVQLPPDLQEHLPEDRLPQAQLQKSHQGCKDGGLCIPWSVIKSQILQCGTGVVSEPRLG